MIEIRLRALRPLVSLSTLVVVALAAAAPSAASEARLAAAKIDGSQHYSATELADTYRDHLGAPLSADRIDAIVTAIEQRYIDDGYRRPQVRFDRRLLERGVLRLVVSESDGGYVRVSGSAGPHQARVDAWLRDIDGGQASRAEMAATVRRINRLPGVDADARLDGSGRLDVALDYSAVETSVFATNRGIDDLGQHIIAARLRSNALSSSLGVVDLKAQVSPSIDQYRGAGIGVSKGFFDAGLTLRAGVSLSEAQPDVVAGANERLFERERAYIGVQKDLVDARNLRWSVGAELAARNSTYSDPADTTNTFLRDERTRVLEFDTRVAMRTDAGNVYRSAVYARKGLDGLGAGIDSVSSTPELREIDFWLAGFELARISEPRDGWRLELGLAGQYSDSILPGSERFRIGGKDFGRAYERSEVSGDTGLAGSVELGRELGSRFDLLPNAMVYGFWDAGAVWPDDYSGRQSAASGGLGLSTRGEHVRAYIEAAKPLTRPSEVGVHDVKFFGGLSLRF